uniref:Uncharacterized protein n=1 Tax=Anopheles darlingi TaxID=43151 RepID=A0A2M4D0E8_ANODA
MLFPPWVFVFIFVLLVFASGFICGFQPTLTFITVSSCVLPYLRFMRSCVPIHSFVRSCSPTNSRGRRSHRHHSPRPPHYHYFFFYTITRSLPSVSLCFSLSLCL